MAKISENSIRDVLHEDWSKDSRNGLPYGGKAVREALQDTISRLSEGKLGAVWLDTASMKLLVFASVEDKQKYIDTEDESLVIDSQEVIFSGTQKKITAIKDGGGNTVYFTSNADTADLTFSFASFEKEITDTEWRPFSEDALFAVSVDKGAIGKYVVITEGNFVKYGETFTVDVLRFLSIGENRVKVTVTGTTSGQSGDLVINANLTTMYLSPSNFAWNVPFIEGRPYNLGGMNIGGALDKTMYIKLANEGGFSKTYEHHIGTKIFTTNPFFYTDLEFPSAGTGVYNVEVWLQADTLESDHLKYNIMCVAKDDVGTAQLCCISNVADKVVNYSDNTLFDFAVYNRGSVSSDPSIRIISVINTNPTVLTDEKMADVPTATVVPYKTNLEIETEESDIKLDVLLGFGVEQKVVYVVDNSASYPATSGASFYMNAAIRNNTQENRYSLINEVTKGSVIAEWTNMSWANGADGWTTDDTGRKCLALPAMTRCSIQYRPLEKIGNGKTIEITYKVRNAADLNEPVITICDDPQNDAFRGVRILPTEVVVHSRDLNKADSDQGYMPKDEEIVNLQISIIRGYKTSYGNLCKIYVNGVVKREFAFSNSDDFATNANIILGSDNADLYVYSIRTYESALGSMDAMKNWVASLPNSNSKKVAWNYIESVIDDSNAMNYDNAVKHANVVTVEMLNHADLPHYGLNKSYSAYSNVEVFWHDHPEWNYVLKNVHTSGQGTTSMNYWLWNLRFRGDKASASKPLTVSYADGTEDVFTTKGSIRFDGNNHPAVQRITAKINYASSMQSHKMGATAMFNDLHHELGLDNEAGGRVAVYQEPFYFFEKVQIEGSSQYTYRFMGLFTMGPDKGDKATFGYDNKTYKGSLIHMEGTDHQIKGVGMDYPWSGMTIHENAEGDRFISVDKGNDNYDNAWEIGASGSADTVSDVKTYLEAEFKPAYDVAYGNSTMILGVTETLAQINTDVNAFGLKKDKDGHAYQRYEVFTDGVYDLYYLDKKTGRYEKNGVNLLEDCGLTASDLSGKTLDEKTEMFRQARRARFKANMEDYWHLNDCLFHMCFLDLVGATDNFKKNSYPYKFAKLADGGRWRWRQDDLDTLFDIDNQGKPEKSYSIEPKDFTDESKTAYVFKGEDSVFWTLIYECYPNELKNMGKKMLTAMSELSTEGVTSIDKLLGFFADYMWDKAQNYFTKSAYNADAELKYEEAWPNYASGSYSVDVHPLQQSLGDHLEAEMRWTFMRLIYMMSKWGYGSFAQYTDASLGRITFRTQLAQGFDLTPYMDLYPTILSGQGASHAGARTKAGESTRINGVGGTNTNVYIVGADLLEDIGDLSTLAVDASGDPVLGVASKRLKSLKLGDEDATKVTSNLATLNLGQCDSLVKVDARNLASLTGTVDLSQCPRLKEALFAGTDVRSLEFANGSKITHIQLSDKITALTLRNLTKLETLDYNDIGNVEFFRIENCTSLHPFEMLKDIYNAEGNNLQGIRVVGFDFKGTAEDVQFLAALAGDVDKDGIHHDYKGIDSDGNVQDITPVIEGRIEIDGFLYKVDYDMVKSQFPQAVIAFNGEWYVRFNNKLVQEIAVAKWGDGIGITEEQAKSVKKLDKAFEADSGITYFNDLDKFPSLTSLSDSFTGNTDLTTFDGTGADVSNLTEFGSSNYGINSAFYGCTSLASFIAPNWKFKPDTYIQMNGIFRFTDSLEEVDMSSWDIYGMSFGYMSNHGNFESLSIKVIKFPDNLRIKASHTQPNNCPIINCQSLEWLELRGVTYTDKESMPLARTFQPNLKHLDIRGWKSENGYMIKPCRIGGVETIDVSDWDVHNVLTFSGFFENDEDVKELDISSWKPEVVNNVSWMFNSCKKLESVKGLTVLKGNPIKTAEYMFSACFELASVDVSGWDMSLCDTFKGMFQNNKKLTSITGVDTWSLSSSKKSELYSMFSGCTSLESISIGNLLFIANNDVNSGGSCIFQGDSALVSIDIKGNGGDLKMHFANTFNGCRNLKALDFTSYGTIYTTSTANAFTNCLALTTLKFNTWDATHQYNNWSGGEFTNCSKLTTVEGTIRNWDTNLSLAQSNLLTRESALVFINGLYDYASEGSTDTHTVAFHSNVKALLTEDDIAIATDKGWTIA